MDIRQARVLILTTHGVEQSELTVPRDELRRAGAAVDVASLDGKAVRAWKGEDWADTIDVDTAAGRISPDDYAALVLPGGQINPDLLRVDETAMGIVRAFLDAGKVVAAICHGPWLLVEADAVRGREVTSYKSIRTDVVNAGGKWVDRAVCATDGIVTSRSPEDLPAFVAKIVEEIGEGRHERRRAA